MDIRTIRSFVRVAELNSFSKAATELDYVQSTVTMQIRQLEQELGYPLFDRIGKRVSLTSSGAEFLVYAYELLHVVEKAETLGAGIPRGTLRVGVLESLLLGPLRERVPAFKLAYPAVGLRIKTGEATNLLQLLKQNQLDMVYLNAAVNTDPELRCCCQKENTMIFICSPTHAATGCRSLTVQELFSHEFVVTEHSGFCYRRLQELAAQQNVMLHHSIEIENTSVIIDLVRRGMGIGFLPQYAVQRQLHDGSLVTVGTELPPQVFYSQLLCHKSRWVSPAMEAFIKAVEE